jgi:uncharacterized protein
MRRKEKEITDPARIEDIIARAQVCHLGLCDKGVTYVVPVSFGYRDKNLFFHCASEGRKLDVIRANNIVCFEMEVDVEVVKKDKPCQWGARFRSVIGRGRASLVQGADEKARALAIIMSHYNGAYSSFDTTALDKVTVVQVSVESLTAKQSGY